MSQGGKSRCDRRYTQASSGYLQKKMRQADDRLARNLIGMSTQSINSGQNTRANSLLTTSHQGGASSYARATGYQKSSGVAVYQRNRDLDRCGTGALNRKDSEGQLKASGS